MTTMKALLTGRPKVPRPKPLPRKVVTPKMCPQCYQDFTPNGSKHTYCSNRCRAAAHHKKPGARESDIERYLVKRVKDLGGEVRKVKFIGHDGAPDRLVMLPGIVKDHRGVVVTDRTIWIELKTPGGKATFPKNAHERRQQREHKRLRDMGQRVEVVDSIEGVEEVLR